MWRGMEEGGGARRTAALQPPAIESFAYTGKGGGKGGKRGEEELIERFLMRRAEKKRAMRAALAERERSVLEAGSEPRILTSQDIRASSSSSPSQPAKRNASSSSSPSQPAKRNWEEMLANCSRKLQRMKAQEQVIKAQEEMIASLTYAYTDDGLQHPKKKKRNKFIPSNFIRARLGDRYIIVSKWFPLPKGATHPEIIDQKEMEMIWKQRDKDRRRKLAQLSPAQRSSHAYKRVYHSTWKPPPSPYRLLQESHYSDPWRVLVICVLLNITTGRQVEKVLPRLFHLCPNAEAATKVPNEAIEEVIKSCGLYQKRADDIKKLSAEYLDSNWTHVTELHNVGKYAADAYAIFCVGKPEAVVPDDHKLVDYWRFVLEKKQAEELDQKRKERKRVEF